MEAYIRSLLNPLLSAPDALSVSETEDERGTLLTVRVARPDMGVVIGREGETIKAVRTLVHMAGVRIDKKMSVKVLEP